MNFRYLLLAAVLGLSACNGSDTSTNKNEADSTFSDLATAKTELEQVTSQVSALESKLKGWVIGGYRTEDCGSELRDNMMKTSCKLPSCSPCSNAVPTLAMPLCRQADMASSPRWFKSKDRRFGSPPIDPNLPPVTDQSINAEVNAELAARFAEAAGMRRAY